MSRLDIQVDGPLDVYIDVVFRLQGLGEWRWRFPWEAGNTTDFSIEFVDPKDQFIYELKGGDSWIKSIEEQWWDNE
jgi:hypothetical protein